MHGPQKKYFVVLVCRCIYLPDDGLVKVETYRRDISDKSVCTVDCTICWTKYCIMSVLDRNWTTLKIPRYSHLILANQLIKFLIPLARASRKVYVYNEVIKKQLCGISSELDIEKCRLQWRNYLE